MGTRELAQRFPFLFRPFPSFLNFL
jgi:hypothetical protein